jgi:hypothetical protein
MLLVSSGGAIASAKGAQLSWEQPALIDPPGQSNAMGCQASEFCYGQAPGTGLHALSCPSTSLCVAADASGNVVTSTDPAGGASTWKVSHIDNNACAPGTCTYESCGGGTCSLRAISCPSASFCAAVDSAGFVFTTSDPALGAGGWSVGDRISTSAALTAISCASEALCVAVDLEGDAIVSTNPSEGAGSWHKDKIDFSSCHNPAPYVLCHDVGPVDQASLSAISCPSTSLCVAGDWLGNLLTTTDPTGGIKAWGTAYVDSLTVAAPIASGVQAAIVGVSCPTASFCVANDESGAALTAQAPTGGASAWKLSRATPSITAAPSPQSLYSLDCLAETFCIGLHSASEVALTHQPANGAEWERAIIDRTGELSGVACPTTSLCLAVDTAGRVLVGRVNPPQVAPSRASRAEIKALLRAELVPTPRPRQIGVLRREKTLLLPIDLPASGLLRVRWLVAPLGRDRRRAKPQTVAGGEVHVLPNRTTKLRLRLTRAGASLLEDRVAVRLIATAVLSSRPGKPIRATKTVVTAPR